MKRQLLTLAMLALAGTLALTSCSKEDLGAQRAPEGIEGYGTIQDGYFVVNFEDNGIRRAGPTSYGANLYSGFTATGGYEPFTQATDPLTGLIYGLNPDGWGSGASFWNGGVAVSNWNYYGQNSEGQSGDWWYSYQNQCSIYNTASTPGTHAGAGNNKSNNFAIVYGYTDDFTYIIKPASMKLSGTTERTFDQMYVCNSAYTYGVITKGNQFTEGSLVAQKGYFKLVVRGYKAGSNTPVAVDTYTLADYTNGQNTLVDKWELFELKNIKQHKVNKLEFDFDGSDSGMYGLNTPAYVCIDDIRMSLN